MSFDYTSMEDVMEDVTEIVQEEDYEVENSLATLYTDREQYSGDSIGEAIEDLYKEIESGFRPEIVVSPTARDHPDDKVSISYVTDNDSLNVQGVRTGMEEYEKEIEDLLKENGFRTE